MPFPCITQSSKFWSYRLFIDLNQLTNSKNGPFKTQPVTSSTNSMDNCNSNSSLHKLNGGNAATNNNNESSICVNLDRDLRESSRESDDHFLDSKLHNDKRASYYHNRAENLARFGRKIGNKRKQARNRLFERDGDINIQLANVPMQRLKYISYPTVQCLPVVLLVPAQFLCGLFIQTIMAGVVFAKLSRPIKRAATILFSRNAVIEIVDGHLCLAFRIGDMRAKRSQLAEAHIRLQMIEHKKTAEGELYPFHQHDMDVGYDSGLDRIFLVWPIIVNHVIDEDSPLYNMNKETLLTGTFEIVIIVEGTVPSTGSTTQARSSYTPNEIKWGHRFEKLMTYHRSNGMYRIDFGKFHNTYEVQCPAVSAKKMDELRKRGLHPEQIYLVQTVEEMENAGETPYDTVHKPSILNPKKPSIIQHHDLIIRLDKVEQEHALEETPESSDEDNKHLALPVNQV